MAKTKTPVVTVSKEVPFVFVLKIENGVYEGRGATGLDALKAIPTPELISSGTLSVTHGDKSKEMLFSGQTLKRIFNPYHQEVLINDLLLGL